MGLAGPKNRTKISADPNNTHWSKSTDRFGHKILLKQGWTPGAFLGAKDAKHAAHYTSANASHIRVAVKDDTLGLGAKRGKAGNETFGLSAFQGLLGRLNGKSDVELKKEESAQRDLQLQVYTNQRWGGIRFVSGGLLVGDKIENLTKKEETASGTEKPEAEKKRKRSGDDERESTLKGKKRKSDLKEGLGSSSQDDSETRAKTKPKLAKSKKTKGEESTDTAALSSASAGEKEDEEKQDKKARREAKKARKLERLAKKEAKGSKKMEKEKRKQKKKKADASSDSSSSEDEATSANNSAPASGTSTPTMSFAGGRLAVRQRYIAQKKRASMDPQALREIFMVKAEA